jgi:hypothetical protein
MTKMTTTERKPRRRNSRRRERPDPPPQVGGRQFHVGYVYPIDVDLVRTIGGKHMHIETQRLVRGSFCVRQIVGPSKDGTLTLLGELIENGEHYVVRLGKGIPRVSR